MILIKLLRWIIGFVQITAADGFKERFLNLCAMSHIPLWDVKNNGDSIKACTTAKGYKKMRKSAKTSQMKLSIIKKKGLPFVINKNKKRMGLLIGFALTIIFISILSTMIWTIDVKGNVNVTEDEVLEVFEDLGVKVGSVKRKIDVSQVEIEASQRLQKLSWLALNINGSKATIEVRESTKVPNVVAKETPCNIIADYDGQIIKCEVYAGKAEQEINSAVVKGDLLISGVLENQDGTERLVHAKGSIVASTQRRIQGKCYSTQVVTRVNSVKVVPKIYFFGLKIPLWFVVNKDNTRFFENKYMLNTDRVILPVGTITSKWIKTSSEKENIDLEKRKLIALNNYFKNEASQIMDADIISQNVEIIENENNTEILGIFKCEEEIGLEQEIYVEYKINE